MELRVSRLTANRNLSASTKTLRFYVFCQLPGKEKRVAAALLRALAAGQGVTDLIAVTRDAGFRDEMRGKAAKQCPLTLASRFDKADRPESQRPCGFGQKCRARCVARLVKGIDHSLRRSALRSSAFWTRTRAAWIKSVPP